jgi:hypothetical protein
MYSHLLHGERFHRDDYGESSEGSKCAQHCDDRGTGAAFEQVKNDDAIRVVVVTGAGDRHCQARIFPRLRDSEARNFQDEARGFDAIEALGWPTIAAVNGYARGCEPMASRVGDGGLGNPVKLGLIPVWTRFRPGKPRALVTDRRFGLI